MRLAALFPLVGCILNFLLAAFVARTGFRQPINRVYLLWGLAVAVWNLGQFFLFTVNDQASASFWGRFLWMGVIFIPVTLFHLSLLIAQVPVKKYIWAFYAVTVALAISNFTPFVVQGFHKLGSSGYYAIAGPGFPIFNLLFCLVFVTIIILVRHRKTLGPRQGNQLGALIFGQTVLVILGTNDLLPIVNITKYPGTEWQVYPYGNSAAVLYGLIVAYNVLHRQLLDVQVQLSRVASQLIRFLFLFFIGLTLLLTATLIAPKEFTLFSFLSGLMALVISGGLAALFFPRLFSGEGLDTLEKRIIGDRFEARDQVRGFMENMAWYTDLGALLNDLHELLAHAFKLSGYQIILRDETSRVFTLFRAHPEQSPRQLTELKVESPVFRFFEWGKSAYLTLNADYLRPASSNLERQALEQLAEFGGQFCFPLASQSEPFGLFIVGPKHDGTSYTATDINLLVALMKNLSLMVNQIRLKNHILQTQEMDLLGRMSRGMAHDLNNLLTPVWTLFQLSTEVSESGKAPEFDDELLPSALRNIKIMRAYIREALFFSENLRPDIQLGRLDMIVKQAAELGRASRKKPVNIITETPDNVLVELDEVLIQRLIANLISNAIDASPENSTIQVELVRLAKTEASRDWLRVRISDQGEGIRKEDLNRIFTPYFTTKTHGDENRGFGLGLAICRKIVNLHGGNVSISSQLKKGTTVELDLPSRQNKIPPPTMVQTA